MKKSVIIGLILVIILLALIGGFYMGVFDKITGKVVFEQNPGEENQIGPSAEEQTCMKKCVTDAGCVIGDVACSEKNNCKTKCNLEEPEETVEQKCVSDCTKKGCGEFDFSCQQKNQAVCDKECGMVKEPEAKSEEEQCIRDCVNKESPGLICQAGEGGEKGNEICQKCAKSCEYLYAGPCLDEMKLEATKSTCNTCEHCYGKPVMGDSGEGYECIVSIECADSSSEFGDNSGTGPGIGQEGFIANVGDALGNVFEGIGNFFKNIFSGGKSEDTNSDTGNSDSVLP